MNLQDDDYHMLDCQGARVFYSKYEPKEVLGTGVSSTVRRCVHKDSGVEYAVKIVDISESVHGADLRESTYGEVDVLKRVLGHPYVIDLHDFFESETHLFLVFELMREGELFDYLTTVVALSEKRTRQIMHQLLEALQFLHANGVVHRDVKPENILLDEDCTTIKLTDFGFARVLAGNEQLFEVLGTPGYMAPEILRAGMYQDSEGYGQPVDLWAAGVVMYTLLVGCPPFWHRKQIVMLRNIVEGHYTFGSPEWDDITDAPKDLIRRMLSVDPVQRLTASQALNHDFFRRPRARIDEVEPVVERFSPVTTFRVAIHCVRAAVRIQRLKLTPEPISVSAAATNPYIVRPLRRVLDACAFRVYGHWVKKAAGQNRAMLFENVCRAEVVAKRLDPALGEVVAS